MKALEFVTDHELELVEKRIWKKIQEGDGYQPFGYDMVTLKITKPELAEALQDVYAEHIRRRGSKSAAEHLHEKLGAGTVG
jgi:hypothetical protein